VRNVAGRSIVNDRAVIPEAQEYISASEDVRTLRAALNTLGDGFVEAIDDNTLRAIAARQPQLSGGRIQKSTAQSASAFGDRKMARPERFDLPAPHSEPDAISNRSAGATRRFRSDVLSAVRFICYMHIAYMDANPKREQSVALQRASGRQWVLKPQDLAVAMKLFLMKGEYLPYAILANQLRLSPFEAHAAVQRLLRARLAVERDGVYRPVMSALRPFVISGAPYAYPPVRGERTIGFPTAHAVAPLKGAVNQSADSFFVWPHPEGSARGTALLPLYPKLPLAARENSQFYELLALFDALRVGQARERELARKFLEERLK
jgi:hypothetical protein